MTCEECIHKAVCYRMDSVQSDYARKCGDFVSCKALEQEPTTKNDLAYNLCDSCTNIRCEFQSGIVRTKCAFYIPPHIKSDNCGNYVVMQPTDDAISREVVKEQMIKYGFRAPDMTVTEFVEDLPSVNPVPNISIQITERENMEDLISRQAVLKQLKGCLTGGEIEYEYVKFHIDSIPSVNPQEPKTGHWIYKQYDGYPEQGNYHCSECDNIDNRTPAYCPHCGCAMIEPQEWKRI